MVLGLHRRQLGGFDDVIVTLWGTWSNLISANLEDWEGLRSKEVPRTTGQNLFDILVEEVI